MKYARCMVYQGWHVMKVDGFTKGDLIQSCGGEAGKEWYNRVCGKANVLMLYEKSAAS